MRRSRRSTYQIHDVMLAVAFTAIGIAWVQAKWEPIRHRAGRIPGWTYIPQRFIADSEIYRSTRSVVATVLYVMTGVASPWTVYLLYRSRRPGRTWRFGRVRRPGAIACLAATAVLIFELIHETVSPTQVVPQINVWYQEDAQEVRIRYWLLDRWPGAVRFQYDPLCTMLGGMSSHAGLVVAGAWLALFLTRAWRPEPAWVDRAGRAIGWFWILAGVHFFLLPL